MLNVEATPTPLTRQLRRSTYIAHYGIRAKELDPMIAWYATVFGAVVHHRSDALAFMSFDEEHHRLVIYEDTGTVDRPPTATGVDHVGYGIATFTEFVESYERLMNAGIRPFLQLNHVFSMSLYYHDPDGNEVELCVDCFPTKQECEDFVRSERMAEIAKPPFGYPFDPSTLVAMSRAGASHQALARLGLPAEAARGV